MTPQLALDIGTRNIVGLLVERNAEGRLRILDGEVLAHEDRAMRDGQVHDIPRVGQRLRDVVMALSRRSGVPLQAATVAAAGRALRTVEVEVRAAVPRPGRVGHELLKQLALQGIGEASDRLGGEVRSGFHCVGYTLGRHVLDGAPLDQPVGQTGSVLEARLIATFLPRVVTDALVAVVREAGLALGGLTLEPIAAAEVAMPSTMRALNLALVDVGAGTSDIAVTHGGAVIGYAMVPLAGDLVTEVLAQHHLLDFPEAEAMKIRWQQAVSPVGPPTVLLARDVLGLEVRVQAEDLQTLVRPALQRWAKAVAEEILRLNGGRAPAAVLAIGGASQTPGLSEALAEALGLPAPRVGVRGSDIVRDVDFGLLGAGTSLTELLRGPAGVTPLGIAFTAVSGPGFRLREIGVRLSPPWQAGDPLVERYREERTVQVLDLGAATVSDGLLAAGFAARDLTGRPGLGLTVTVDEALKLIPAPPGRPAEVRHADRLLTLDEPLPEDAHLVLKLAVAAQGPSATLGDVWGRERELTVLVEDQLVRHVLVPRVEGRVVDWDERLSDGQVCQILPTLSEFAAGLSVPADAELLSFEVEGIPQVLRLADTRWLADGRPIGDAERVVPGMVLSRSRAVRDVPRVRDVMPEPRIVDVSVWWEGRVLRVPGRLPPIVDASGEAIDPDGPVREGGRYRHGAPPLPILADLLALVRDDVTPTSPGGQLRLEVDGVPAEFTTPLREGCRVLVRWTEQEHQPQS
ncbi:MAG: cell division FtsA domain-containing protein [Candidatus Sericytochromatia bacterium]|nr:cell division FtsA domain-containing protein [Candidatus Sericytochromatia bacterium]